MSTPRRDALARALEGEGIQTAIHYPRTLPAQPALEGDWTEAAFPRSATAAREVLSLPFSPELSDQDVDAVAGAIRTWLGSVPAF